MIATGGAALRSIGSASEPKRLDQNVIDDLDDHLAGLDRFHHFRADRAGAGLVDEGAHDVERHVGFEQRAAHFAHRDGDVLLARGRRAASGCRICRRAFRKGPRTCKNPFCSRGLFRRSSPKTSLQSKTRPGAQCAAGRWPPASRRGSAELVRLTQERPRFYLQAPLKSNIQERAFSVANRAARNRLRIIAACGRKRARLYEARSCNGSPSYQCERKSGTGRGNLRPYRIASGSSGSARKGKNTHG